MWVEVEETVVVLYLEVREEMVSDYMCAETLLMDLPDELSVAMMELVVVLRTEMDL